MARRMSDAAVKKLLVGLDRVGWKCGLSSDWLKEISELPIRGDSFQLAAIAAELAYVHRPITLRGLFYRIVSTGYFPNTDKKHYAKLGNLMIKMRRSGCVPYSWIVDNIRATKKPSSWSGLEDFAETVRDAYRKDFWASLPMYVHIFVEKDAMTGVIQPVTEEFDVPLSPVRGYVSDTFAHEIGSEWKRIEKPIHAYYIGDFDPSGFDLERSLRQKLAEHSDRCAEVDGEFLESDGDQPRIYWDRLALCEEDFDSFDLYELAPKKTDSRTRKFIEQFGERCAEVDALAPNIIRDRVREAIESNIPHDEWERLQAVERIERESWESTIGSLKD